MSLLLFAVVLFPVGLRVSTVSTLNPYQGLGFSAAMAIMFATTILACTILWLVSTSCSPWTFFVILWAFLVTQYPSTFNWFLILSDTFPTKVDVIGTPYRLVAKKSRLRFTSDVVGCFCEVWYNVGSLQLAKEEMRGQWDMVEERLASDPGVPKLLWLAIIYVLLYLWILSFVHRPVHPPYVTL